MAGAHSDRRTYILALIGNLVFSWSNNESMFIYVLMILMESDEAVAAIVFATLNTTRARIDLVERLAIAKLAEPTAAGQLAGIVKRFNASTKLRNEFNHCMYSMNDQGEITDTLTMRVEERRGALRIGAKRPMDDRRIAEIVKGIEAMKSLNRDLWTMLPKLKAAMSAAPAHARSNA